jgi:hypothetical protein
LHSLVTGGEIIETTWTLARDFGIQLVPVL